MYRVVFKSYVFFYNLEILENLMYISSNYISPVITWMGKRPTVIVTKPEDIQVVLNNPLCFDKGCFSEFVLPVVGQGLFSASESKLNN